MTADDFRLIANKAEAQMNIGTVPDIRGLIEYLRIAASVIEELDQLLHPTEA